MLVPAHLLDPATLDANVAAIKGQISSILGSDGVARTSAPVGAGTAVLDRTP